MTVFGGRKAARRENPSARTRIVEFSADTRSVDAIAGVVTTAHEHAPIEQLGYARIPPGVVQRARGYPLARHALGAVVELADRVVDEQNEAAIEQLQYMAGMGVDRRSDRSPSGIHDG